MFSKLANLAYLYVEDDPLSQQVMQMLMEMAMGISTLTVFDHSENFMERVKALKPLPSVIMLDIHVKPYSGFELLAMLRADESFRSTKIIALTASVMNEEVNKLRTVGFDGAIGKPISVQSFPDLLLRVVQGETIWYIM